MQKDPSLSKGIKLTCKCKYLQLKEDSEIRKLNRITLHDRKQKASGIVGVVNTSVTSSKKINCQNDLNEKKIKQPQIHGRIFIKMLTQKYFPESSCLLLYSVSVACTVYITKLTFLPPVYSFIPFVLVLSLFFPQSI